MRTLPHGRCAAVAALIAALGVTAAPVQAAPSRPAEVGRVLRALHAGPTRTRVVVTLRSPSLVAFARSQRSLQGFGSARRVLAGALGSRAYLGELSSYQADETALIERRVPGARIGWRYRTVLDGLSVSLRRGQLARLAATPGVERVYPDLTYHALTDTVPAVVDAVPLWGPSLAGAGTGMKIGIIDDGIDQTNPFLSGAGFTPPPGFPLGDRRYTTGKVIVARAFPPPGASAASRLPFDPKVSEHGTHVSGIAAGDAGTNAVPGGNLPPVANLSGVAPRAYLGNYRGLAVADPVYGSVGGTAELAAAVDSAVADGMDVLNLSLGGTEIDPREDALARAVQGAVQAGVVVAVAAGNSYDTLKGGSLESPGSSSDVITVAAATTSRFFGVPGAVVGPGAVPADLVSFGAAVAADPRIPAAFARPQTVVDAGPSSRLCGTPVPGGRLRGRIVLVASGGCGVLRKTIEARIGGAIGVLMRDVTPGDPFPRGESTAVPFASVSDQVGVSLRAFIRAAGGSARITLGRDVVEVPGTARVITDFSSAGPTPYDHLLKPDIAAPGEAILSSVPLVAKGYPGAFAVFDGTSMATPAVAGAAALLRQAHPAWSPLQVKSALMQAAVPAFADTAGLVEASTLRAGAGFLDVAAASDPGVFALPSSLGFGEVHPGASAQIAVALSDAGDGAGDWSAAVDAQPGGPDGVALTVPPTVTVPAGGDATLPVQVAVSGTATPGSLTGHVTLTQGARLRRIPFWVEVTRPLLRAEHATLLRTPGVYTGTTRGGSNRVESYRYPTDASQQGIPARFRGPERLYRFHLASDALNAGVALEPIGRSRVLPLLMLGRDENSLAGEAGLPLDVGPLFYTTGTPAPVAGLMHPVAGDYYVAVDSATTAGAGAYRLRFWVDDTAPPHIRLLTHRVRAGHRAVLHLEITDDASGVDRASLLAVSGRTGLRDVSWDAATGAATIDVSDVPPGLHTMLVVACDNAQTKDVLASNPSRQHTTVVALRYRVLRSP